MASVSTEVILDITPNPTDLNQLNVRARFTVRFSDFDIKSGLEYLECLEIFGIDQVAGEDNTNDLLASLNAAFIKSGGSANLNRDIQVAVQRATLDEDKPPVPNPDELQVRVTLTPMLPVEVTRNSSTKLISLP